MLFHTLKFFCFFLVVYHIYIRVDHRWQNRLLLVASYYFYGSWDWRFLSLIVASTLVDYFCGLKIYNTDNKAAKRKYLFLSLVTNLGLLGFFKYFNFFAANFYDLFSHLGFSVSPIFLHIILPVGISFYTFQTLSYTIDIYNGKIKPEKNLLDFALFVAFFPQLVAGPIERAKSLIPQVKSERKVDFTMIKEGLWLFCYGFFLKVFIADPMVKIVDQVFNVADPVSSGIVSLMGIYAFAFQIFGDFAGYSSMAIGISKLLGFDLMTNFLYPYLVTNPSDFWKNWHISLSTWLKDYLYVPLGGNRLGKWLTYRNLMVTMLLGGLWHGAAWTFVLWGFYQGIILVLHRFVTKELSLPKVPMRFERVWFAVKVIVMFHITCLGWLIFRAQSIGQIGYMLGNIFTRLGVDMPQGLSFGAQILKYTWLFWVIHFIQKSGDNNYAILQLSRRFKYPIYFGMVCSVMFIIVTTLLSHGKFGDQPFIYFQF